MDLRRAGKQAGGSLRGAEEMKPEEEDIWPTNLIGIRQITSPTNQRTIIACILPPKVAVGGSALVLDVGCFPAGSGSLRRSD